MWFNSIKMRGHKTESGQRPSMQGQRVAEATYRRETTAACLSWRGGGGGSETPREAFYFNEWNRDFYFYFFLWKTALCSDQTLTHFPHGVFMCRPMSPSLSVSALTETSRTACLKSLQYLSAHPWFFYSVQAGLLHAWHRGMQEQSWHASCHLAVMWVLLTGGKETAFTLFHH